MNSFEWDYFITLTLDSPRLSFPAKKDVWTADEANTFLRYNTTHTPSIVIDPEVAKGMFRRLRKRLESSLSRKTGRKVVIDFFLFAGCTRPDGKPHIHVLLKAADWADGLNDYKLRRMWQKIGGGSQVKCEAVENKEAVITYILNNQTQSIDGILDIGGRVRNENRKSACVK